MKDFLTDIEKEKIQAFLTDPTMAEAVKKVLLAGIYYNGTLKPGIKADPLKNFALSLAFDPKYSNEELGADLRAMAEGISFVEKGFKELGTVAESLIKSPLTEEDVNPGL